MYAAKTGHQVRPRVGKLLDHVRRREDGQKKEWQQRDNKLTLVCSFTER
jgi:hypothetical protein